MAYWPGTCIVHEIFSAQEIASLKARNPRAEVIAHPECDDPVLSLAGFVGSTSALIDHVVESPVEEFIVATEPGVLAPDGAPGRPARSSFRRPGQGSCSCNTCPFMRLNTLEKLYLCLRDLTPCVELTPELILGAKLPLERMLRFSAGGGLWF